MNFCFPIELDSNSINGIRRIEEIAEDIETQLLERIVAPPWYALLVDESTDIDNKILILVYVRYFYQENLHENLL